MEDRSIRYTIYKKNVWIEVVYKDVVMNTKVVYEGRSKKDCERWINNHAKENR